jgi:hypothetical protein
MLGQNRQFKRPMFVKRLCSHHRTLTIQKQSLFRLSLENTRILINVNWIVQSENHHSCRTRQPWMLQHPTVCPHCKVEKHQSIKTVKQQNENENENENEKRMI